MGHMPAYESACGSDADGTGTRVRCRIARGRVGEMLARGWILLDTADESWVMMEGPELGGETVPLGRSFHSLYVRSCLMREFSMEDEEERVTSFV